MHNESDSWRRGYPYRVSFHAAAVLEKSTPSARGPSGYLDRSSQRGDLNFTNSPGK